MRGECVWFKQTYGFVKAETTGDEYFIHESEIEMDGYRKLVAGEKVEFDVAMGPRGKLQAENVRRIK